MPAQIQYDDGDLRWHDMSEFLWHAVAPVACGRLTDYQRTVRAGSALRCVGVRVRVKVRVRVRVWVRVSVRFIIRVRVRVSVSVRVSVRVRVRVDVRVSVRVRVRFRFCGRFDVEVITVAFVPIHHLNEG